MKQPTPPVEANDPVFRHARREARVIVCIWMVFAGWVIGYAAWKAFVGPESSEIPPTFLGMPSWVCWGIALPWLAANAATFWFCFRYMADDPLHEVPQESPPPDPPKRG